MKSWLTAELHCQYGFFYWDLPNNLPSYLPTRQHRAHLHLLPDIGNVSIACGLCLLNSPSREYGVDVSRLRLMMRSFHLVRGLPGFLWPCAGSHPYSLSGSRVLSILCPNHWRRRLWIILASCGLSSLSADVIVSYMLWPFDFENFSLKPQIEGIYPFSDMYHRA